MVDQRKDFGQIHSQSAFVNLYVEGGNVVVGCDVNLSVEKSQGSLRVSYDLEVAFATVGFAKKVAGTNLVRQLGVGNNNHNQLGSVNFFFGHFHNWFEFGKGGCRAGN